MAEDVCSTTQSPIEAHGIIGDMRSAALVADNGSIDFCCWPEFDSPSIFTALLDCDRAGVFELAPDLPTARRQQIYLPDSNVLQTRWIDHDAVGLDGALRSAADVFSHCFGTPDTGSCRRR